tara:strand:+ start:4108 stop:5211 length:1104 start_codon:yes stop_codon:yes gene_type:complete
MKDKYLASEVNTSQGNYRVIVGKSIINELGKELDSAGLINKKCFLIADKSMFPKNIKFIHESLESHGYITNSFSTDFSESLKNYNTVEKIYNWLADMKTERKDFIISFGGGVAGDIIGFVASTYLRGIPFVQIPTTLAAMTDASIGGKVAYNLNHGKNLVGSFFQPKLVFEDLDFLNSLPFREKNSGWAEAIKHSLIIDENLFNEFDKDYEQIFNLDTEFSANILKKSVKIKADIVSKDEFETGNERIKLNYGHTIGHAIEKVTNYGNFLHGEAVSIGMMAAINISKELGMVTNTLVEKQKQILEKYQLPIKAEGLSAEKIFEAIKMDKKNSDGKVKWVLLKSIGVSKVVQNVSDEIIMKSIKKVLN